MPLKRKTNRSNKRKSQNPHGFALSYLDKPTGTFAAAKKKANRPTPSGTKNGNVPSSPSDAPQQTSGRRRRCETTRNGTGNKQPRPQTTWPAPTTSSCKDPSGHPGEPLAHSKSDRDVYLAPEPWRHTQAGWVSWRDFFTASSTSSRLCRPADINLSRRSKATSPVEVA